MPFGFSPFLDEVHRPLRQSGRLLVLIAFRLQSEFGLIQSTQLPARMGRSLNRLSASVRIWTEWLEQTDAESAKYES